MINLEEIIRQMTANAAAMRALLQTISEEQAQWKPAPEVWSLNQVMEHVYNEERLDFRKHLKDMLSDPPKPWAAFPHEEYVPVKNCRQAVEAFLREREASLAWLKMQGSTDWDVKSQAMFGPLNEKITFSAGDVLISWLEHDFLHIRQMNELLHAWNVKQAPPYSVDYAGMW